MWNMHEQECVLTVVTTTIAQYLRVKLSSHLDLTLLYLEIDHLFSPLHYIGQSRPKPQMKN